MAKKIIRLTEADLHRIIKESVSRIIRESEEEPSREELESMYNDAVEEVRKYKGKREFVKEFLAAAKKMNDLKIKLGKTKIIKNPSAYWSSEENERRGIKQSNGTDHWRVKDNIKMKAELDKEAKEKDRLKVNDVDAMLGR